MKQEADYSDVNYDKHVLWDMIDLKFKHGKDIKYYLRTEKGKQLMVLVAEL